MGLYFQVEELGRMWIGKGQIIQTHLSFAPNIVTPLFYLFVMSTSLGGMCDVCALVCWLGMGVEAPASSHLGVFPGSPEPLTSFAYVRVLWS